MRPHRFLLIVLLLVASLLSACSDQELQEWTNGPVPTCDTTSRGRLLLMAQSVPEASLIPCIGGMPPGWSFHRAHSQSDESALRFDNDTFDLSLDVILTPSCEVSAAREIESDRAATRLFADTSGEKLSYTFAGGCITFAYQTSQLANSDEGQAMRQAVPFLSRAHLRSASGWTL